MMNEWRRRNRTPDTAIRQSGDRARTQAQAIKNYNTQTAYESLEDRGPKKGSYFLGRGRDWRLKTGDRGQKKKTKYQKRRSWENGLERGSHTIDTPALFCMCVCVSGWATTQCVCVCVLLRIQDTRPLTGKITTDSSCGYMAMDRHEREKQRAVSVSQSQTQLSFSFSFDFCALANIVMTVDTRSLRARRVICEGKGVRGVSGATTMGSGFGACVAVLLNELNLVGLWPKSESERDARGDRLWWSEWEMLVGEYGSWGVEELVVGALERWRGTQPHLYGVLLTL